MSLIEDFNRAKQAIFDHVGYVEDWQVFPVEDSTQYFWRLHSYYNEPAACVGFAKTEVELYTEEDGYYSNELYYSRLLKKAVYRGADYTMVVVDTHTDGNKLIQIFSNSMERPKNA